MLILELKLIFSVCKHICSSIVRFYCAFFMSKCCWKSFLWHQHIINNQTMNSYFTHNSKEMFLHCMFFLWSLSLWCYISFWSWKTEQDRKQWQRIDIVLRRSEYLSSRENMILFKEYRVTLQQDLAAPSLLPKKQPMVNDLCEAYCTSLLLSFSFSITACIISY